MVEFIAVSPCNRSVSPDGARRLSGSLVSQRAQLLECVRKFSNHQNESGRLPQSQEELMPWAEWARAQADDLDPIVSGGFQIDGLPDQSERSLDPSVVPE